MKRAVVVLLLITLAGCATVVAPQAEAIRTAYDKNEVVPRTLLGTIAAHPPY